MNRDTATLLENIRDHLADDAAIRAWCQTAGYDRPTIYLGVDENDPPPASAYPVIVIGGFSREDGNSYEIIYSVDIAVGISNNSVSVSEDRKTVTYSGMIEAENLADHVEKSLLRAAFAAVTFQAEASQETFGDLHVSYTTARISVPVKKRRRI